MASWCGPCKQEFKDAKKLESYFQENNIVKLFISIDRIEAVENAIKVIQNDSLSGYFVSWLPKNESDTSSFRQDITDMFFTIDGEIITVLPIYAIVDRKGLVKRAARPSNPTRLKEQLEEHL